MRADATILVLHCGSSSVKAAWFRPDTDLDPDHNQCQVRAISTPESPVVVNVVAANEELIIARHTFRLGIAEHGQLRTVGHRSTS